jgi:hypothetical protein
MKMGVANAKQTIRRTQFDIATKLKLRTGGYVAW